MVIVTPSRKGMLKFLFNIELEYMGQVSDSQPIFRVPDPVPRELATLLAPQ